MAPGIHEEWSRAKYKSTITIRFGAKLFDDPLAKLMKLRQMGTVEQYQESFDSLLNRVDLPTSTSHAVSCFLSGLNEEIQNVFRMYDAYCLAKIKEATLASIAKKAKPILDRIPSYSRGMGARYGSTRTPQPWNPTSRRTRSSARGEFE